MRRSMMLVVAGAVAAAGALAAPETAGAQAWGRDGAGVPPGHRPPPGMCRIWINGVPAGQQPAPTDCATAVRNRPANGRVIFGDDDAKPGEEKGRGKKGKKPAAQDADDDDRRGRAQPKQDDDDDRDRRRGDDDARDDRKRGGSDDDRRDDRDRVSGAEGRALPAMAAAAQAQRGQRTSEMVRWLGNGNATVRTTDADGDGTPERAVWMDQAGRVLQVWIDRDRDGRADRVELFENGRRVQVVGQ